MRTFRIGSGPDRKSVTLEVDGPWLRVTKEKADGSTKVEMKEFANGDRAHSAGDEAARSLIAHGYREWNSRQEAAREADSSRMVTTSKAPDLGSRAGSGVGHSQPIEPTRPRRTPAPEPEPRKKRAKASEEPPVIDLGFLFEESGEEDSETAESTLVRRAPAQGVAPGKKPARKKRKKRKSARSADELDRRVIVGFAAVGMLCVGVVGFLAYAAFFKPASIVGHWEGSRTEHEIGKFLTNTQYRLILDERGQASMAMGEGGASSGTYVFTKGILKLSFKDEEGEVSEVQYRAELGGATLDLYDEGDRKVVQLIRYHRDPVVGGGKPKTAAPANVAVGEADPAADERLASVPLAAKDGAFQLRHPKGWAAETGGRADNSYSWAEFTDGTAKIRIYADVAGSLMAGPNTQDHEEGSETAPVHGAHLRYSKDAAELYSKYDESQPATFKGSRLGEGRIATFKATDGAVFGTEVRGIRVTLLTNDRRVSVLCDAPTKQFEGMLPTFLATCRSLSR